METTLRRRSEKQIPLYGNDKRDSYRRNEQQHFWAAGSATIGAAVWAGMAVAARAGIARMGAVELIFLFAPLVAVPLGMALGGAISGSGWCDSAASRLQPLGAALAVIAMWLPPGRNAGLVALGWMLVCVLLAGGGVVELVQASWSDAGRKVKGAPAPQLRLRRSIWLLAGLGWWLRGWGCGPWEFRNRSGC